MPKEKQPKILIADDSAFMRKIMVDVVEKAGFTNLIEAENGKEVLEIYEKEKPDIILMDLIMPEMDGLSALEKLVPLGAKVIVISAIGQESIIKQAFDMGAKGYFIKPFFVREKIAERINTVLSGEKFIPDEIEEAEIKEFEAVAKHGAEAAAEAFGTIVKEPVEVETTEVKIADLFEEIEKIKKQGVGLVIVVTGLLADVPGASILLISEKEAKTLIDLLNGQEIGTTKTLAGDLERSTVEEVLNMLANSYMSVLGEMNVAMLAGSVPQLVSLQELDKFLVKFLKSKELPRPQKTVVFKTVLNIAKHKIIADLSFLFREEILQKKIKK